MITLLKQAAKINLFNSLDIELAIRLVKNKNPLLLFIFALLSAETRAGHVCLFIDKLHPIYLFEGKHTKIAFDLWKIAGTPKISKIYTELKQCNAVCDAQKLKVKPLVLSGNKLYFQRMWANEGLVADFFSRHIFEMVDEQKLKTILNFFLKPSKTHNWQKIAIALAVTNKITVISGGPGTGKTTIIALLLATLVQLNDKKLIIQLVAPTGKAAARLTESLNNELLKINLPQDKKSVIPKQAQTIHRLLGAQPDSQSLYYNKDNPLLLDVLIIDEASMIDLNMMAKLIQALPKYTRVILLGDKDQLSSVEAGSVLGDLCYFSRYGYSYAKASQITKITNYDLSNYISNEGPKIKDHICLLKKSYRFDKKSEIGKFATAINQNNIKYIKQVLTQQKKNITFHSIDSTQEYITLISDAATCYRSYLDIIKNRGDPEEILTAFNNYRLLSAVREGQYGVIGLNNKLEQLLYFKKIIPNTEYSWNKNYEGRPIIITRNDHYLGIYNGDIGIILRDNNDLKAYFRLPNGKIKKIQPSSLPQHETAFVMTVHKSQGSEFKHVALVLPPNFMPIINKELIYTAITRAKNNITIYANWHVFIKGLITSIERRSGLIERLM